MRVVRERARDADAVAAFEPRAQRPVAHEGQRALAETLEGAREADDVLALGQRPDAEEGRSLAGRALERPEALEVDAAVDHLRLPSRLRDALLEQAAEVARHRDHRGRTPDDEPRRSADARDRADVRDVLPVRGDDERGAGRERGDQPGRDEEVCVRHVRPPSRAAFAAAGPDDAAARRRECRARPVRPRDRTRRAPARDRGRTRPGRARSAMGTSARRAGSARPEGISSEGMVVRVPSVRVQELTKTYHVHEREAGLRAAAASLVRRKTRDVHAVDGDLVRGRAGRGGRLPRPERRRQDDDAEDALRPALPDSGGDGAVLGHVALGASATSCARSRW